MTSRLAEFRTALGSMEGVVAFDSPALLSICGELRRGVPVSDERLKALKRSTRQAVGSSSSRPTLLPSAAAGKSVAVVSLTGVGLYDFDFWPYCFSTKALARTIAGLADDASVASIVLDINTPGGQVTGTQEAADAVFAARRKKRVIGLVNPLCASAGYWIASQCSEIIGVPSADIGSIGVFMCHFDISEALAAAGVKATFIKAPPYKAEGNSLEPLSAEAKAFYQTQVDATYRDFVAAVARGRGTTPETVKSRMGGGRCLMARDALKAGMIDTIAMPDVALQRVASGSVPTRSVSARQADEHRRRIAELAAESMSPTERARKAETDRVRQRLAILSA